MEELAVIAPVLSKKTLEVAYDRLVENPEDQKSILLDLNHAPSMQNLPPAYIVTAEFDPLRDEGAYYASRLSDNAVSVSTSSALSVSGPCSSLKPLPLPVNMFSACQYQMSRSTAW